MKECVYVPEGRYVKNYHVGIHNRNQSPRYDDVILSVIEATPTIEGDEFVRQVALKDGMFRTPLALEAKLRNMPSFYADTTDRLQRDLRRMGKLAKKAKRSFISEENKRLRDIRARDIEAMAVSGDVSKLGEMMTLKAASRLIGSAYRLKNTDRYFDTQTGLVMVETKPVLDALKAHGLPPAQAGKGSHVAKLKAAGKGRGRVKGTPKPRSHPESELREMIVAKIAAHPGMMVSELRKEIPCHNWRLNDLLRNMTKDGTLRSEPAVRKGSVRYYVTMALKMEPPPSAKGKLETAKQRLISMGKSKGFLTYDDINDSMPKEIVSSGQIDEWLSTLGDEGIAVVDSATNFKLAAPPIPSDDWIKELKDDGRFMPYYFKHIKSRANDGNDDRFIFDLVSHNPDISAQEFMERIAKQTGLYRFPAGLQLRVRQNRMHFSHDTRSLCQGLEVMKKELRRRADEWRRRERAEGGSVEVLEIGRVMSRDRAFKEVGRVWNRLKDLPYVVDRETAILLYQAGDVMAVKAHVNAPVRAKPIRSKSVKEETGVVDHDVVIKSVPDPPSDRLDRCKRLILSHLRSDRPTVVRDLESKIHTSHQYIKMALAVLMGEGKVRKEPGRKKSSWRYYLVSQRTAVAAASKPDNGATVTQPQPQVVSGKATKCGVCHGKVLPGDVFCARCGGSVKRKCPRCNFDLRPKAEFCVGCGRKIEKTQPAAHAA